jgi:hypothetical protein
MLGAWIAIIIGVVTALVLAFYELYSSDSAKPLKVRDKRPRKHHRHHQDKAQAGGVKQDPDLRPGTTSGDCRLSIRVYLDRLCA